MPLNDFFILETIGKGSFAIVHKVIRKSDRKVYALKRVRIHKMTKKEIADTLNEIRLLASINHKNIVGFYEAFLDQNESEICIIMEYCGCGDLSQKVERYRRRRQYIDEHTIWRYLIQSLKALQYLHERGICHRDIKTANTFLCDDGSIKIGDMNVSKQLKHGMLQTQIGTPYYMPPEIWCSRPYDSSCDIWSLGCMIYELICLRTPFHGDDYSSLRRAVIGGRMPPIPRKYSDALAKLLSSMLRVNARDRPTAQVLLQSSDIIARLHLDHSSIPPSRNERQISLMETIRVPKNLGQLNEILSKYSEGPEVSAQNSVVATELSTNSQFQDENRNENVLNIKVIEPAKEFSYLPKPPQSSEVRPPVRHSKEGGGNYRHGHVNYSIAAPMAPRVIKPIGLPNRNLYISKK